MFSEFEIEKFSKLIEQSDVIVVEGKKDKTVLYKMGLSNVIDISGKSIENFINIVISKSPENVIILTDFDKEGEKKFEEISKLLHHHGIKINNFTRKRFKMLFKVTKIEELNSFFKTNYTD